MGADLTIGPVIDEGFYYDCFMDGRSIREEDLTTIEKKIQTVINERQVFQRVRVSREEALGMFQENKFKVELINGLPEVEYKAFYYYCCWPSFQCDQPHYSPILYKRINIHL